MRLRVDAVIGEYVVWCTCGGFLNAGKSNYPASVSLETLLHGAHNGDIIDWNSSEYFEMCPPKL